MRNRRQGVGATGPIIIAAVLLTGFTQSVVGAPSEDEVPTITMVQGLDGKLNIQIKDGYGEPLGTAQMPEWEVVAQQIRLHGVDSRSVTVSELVWPDKIQSVITGDEICLVYERDPEQAAPALEWVSTLDEEIFVLTAGQGGCGGCVNISGHDYDAGLDECVAAPPDHVCTLCISNPCPDPEPEPEPDPEPEPEPGPEPEPDPDPPYPDPEPECASWDIQDEDCWPPDSGPGDQWDLEPERAWLEFFLY